MLPSKMIAFQHFNNDQAYLIYILFNVQNETHLHLLKEARPSSRLCVCMLTLTSPFHNIPK